MKVEGEYREMKEEKTRLSVLLGILVVAVVLTVGVSFALWQITLQQESTNVITTGCLNLTLTDGTTDNTGSFSLNNAYPMTDDEGKALTPYTFTIENTCTGTTDYVINLETVSTGDKILPDQYVKTSLKNDTTEVFLGLLNTEHENTEKVITEASKAYKLHQGSIAGGATQSFSLNLWMDYDTPAIDEVMSASYQGKITVSATIQNPTTPDTPETP